MCLFVNIMNMYFSHTLYNNTSSQRLPEAPPLPCPPNAALITRKYVTASFTYTVKWHGFIRHIDRQTVWGSASPHTVLLTSTTPHTVLQVLTSTTRCRSGSNQPALHSQWLSRNVSTSPVAWSAPLILARTKPTQTLNKKNNEIRSAGRGRGKKR